MSIFSRQTFEPHDHSHPRSREIHAEDARLAKLLKQQERHYDSANAGENTESAPCDHTERLAIAFNLLQQPPPSPIRITKNMRICGDCRKYSKVKTSDPTGSISLARCDNEADRNDP